jgi:flagellar biosynthesis protein FlhF
MDVERIGGAEQLRSYAVILGAGFHLVDAPCVLPQMLAEFDSKDLVLIDTPGFGARDMDSAAEVVALLSGMADVDCHLVIPASMRPADVLRVCDRFKPFGIAKLLFTKVDETEGTGAILNAAVRTGKPVSFLTNGQQVPEDLEPATSRRLTEVTLPAQLRNDTRQLPRTTQKTTGAAA